MADLMEFLTKKRDDSDRQRKETEALLIEWRESVRALYDSIIGWMDEPYRMGMVRFDDTNNKPITEERFGPYEIQMLALEFQYPTTRVVLEPVARFIVGGRGRVDISGRGGRFKIIRDRDGAEWSVILADETGAKPFKRAPFNVDTFTSVLEILLK